MSFVSKILRAFFVLSVVTFVVKYVNFTTNALKGSHKGDEKRRIRSIAISNIA